MTDRIRSTNVRFNLDKEIPAQAWQYLQTMDRQEFKSYSHVIALALVDYFDRYYRTQEDPYLETREREEQFVNQIVEYIVHNGMMKDLSVLQESPFTDRGSVVEIFTDLSVWMGIRSVIDRINANAAA